MLILASASPRRQELLRYITQDFIVVLPDCDESVLPFISTEKTAEHLATKKAAVVACRYPEDTVIGADTVVVVNGKILGKPKDYDECVAMLNMLSGTAHNVYTGVAVAKDGIIRSFTDKSFVEFYELSTDAIADYASTSEPYDKAGGYGIQGRGALLVQRIFGDYYGIMGLPIARLSRLLAEL